MIGCFPDPYPDELLYGACARFSARVQYPNKKSILRELFGTTNCTATIELPSHLTKLVSALPPGHLYTAGQIIDDHTLLPLYSPFLPRERVARLRDGMTGLGGHVLHRSAGIMASRVPTLEWFRFCPACVVDDRKDPGETYWHRLHQLPGILVCPRHNVFLEDSEARRDSARDALRFVPAEDAARTVAARHLDLSDSTHQLLLKLARDAGWLLNQKALGVDLNAIHSRYLNLLIGRGLATYTGSIHVKELISEFSACYSPALLKLLHCELRGADVEKTNWLLRLVRPPKHAQHPLYHLLLIQFLGLTAEEFFGQPAGMTPFGEGPWPCLNPAADHYRESVVAECQLGGRLRYGRPTGRFSCGCGFAYARTGPDSSPEGRFRAGRVLSFGPVWEAQLKLLWGDPSLSVSEVGRRLGVDPLTVRRHVVRLGLPLSRPSKKLMPLGRAARLKGDASSAAWEDKRRMCRSRGLSAIKLGRGEIKLKALRRKLPRVYAWLLQNDSDWLERHKPQHRRHHLPTTSVNWKKRDAKYAVTVRAAASRIRESVGRPVRVTRTAVGRALGAITLLCQKLCKMPLTAQALTEVIETSVEYAVRRVRWAAECFMREHTLPRPCQLVLRASVYSLRNIPEVKRAVDAAMTSIESNLPFSRRRTA